MRTKPICYFTFLLLIVSALSFSGCSKLFGPSDAEVIKAIDESGVFKDLTMQSPIVILEKGGRNKDGAWPVKVKVKFTYAISKDQASAPIEKTLIFYMHKAKDSAGKDTWNAALNP